MKARWSKTALTELNEHFLYVFERSPAAAKSVVRRIEALISQLEQFPYRGHEADEPGAQRRPLSVRRSIRCRFDDE